MAVLAAAISLAVAGCATSPAGGDRTSTARAMMLSANAVHDDTIRFLINRAPVFAPGDECAAFTPRMRADAGVPRDASATPMEPGHGCWTTADNVVAILTTATPFGDFWRRDYPDDDGSGLTAMMVDKSEAQLSERFLLDNRYYAVRVGTQRAAGLDSGATKTICMLTIDTGSARPLQITLTQQVARADPAVKTVRQQCDLAATIAHTVLDEHDPGGGSRVS